MRYRSVKHVFLAVVLSFVLPSMASALTAFTCPGNITVNYDPPLTVDTQATEYEGEGSFGPCVGLPLNKPGSATVEVFGGGELACVLGTSSLEAVIHWSNGFGDSTAEAEFGVSARPAGLIVVVATGEITSGAFAGAVMTITATLVAPNPTDCLGAGVAQVSGVASMTIADP